jgi:cytochrome b
MNTPSVFPSDADSKTVLVWDAPVRIFHWLLALSFAGAYFTAESERWRLVHVSMGYTLAGLVVFRLLWGLLGTRHARFANFVRGPQAVTRYLKSLLSRQPEHHTGHNPAGALAIVGLLSLALLVAATGWSAYNDLGGEWLNEFHEGVANTMLILVGVHIAGVIVSSWMHRDKLVRAMFTGRKPGQASEGIRSAWWSVSVLLLACVLGFWYLVWQSAPTGVNGPERSAASQTKAHNDDD